jgi:hypothetical protein
MGKLGGSKTATVLTSQVGYTCSSNSYGAPFQKQAVTESEEIDYERNGESGVLNTIATVLKGCVNIQLGSSRHKHDNRTPLCVSDSRKT